MKAFTTSRWHRAGRALLAASLGWSSTWAASGSDWLLPANEPGVSAEPAQPLSRARAAAKALKHGELTAANRLINEALKLNPRQAEFHLLNALIYHLQARQGDAEKLETAIQGYLQVIQLEPANLSAHELLAYAYLDRRDYARAQQSLAELAVLEPDDPSVLARLMGVSYLAADAVTACAVADQLAGQSGRLDEGTRLSFLKMAVPAYGACRETAKVRRSLDQLRAAGVEPQALRALESRAGQWEQFHAHVAPLLKVQMPAPATAGMPGMAGPGMPPQGMGAGPSGPYGSGGSSPGSTEPQGGSATPGLPNPNGTTGATADGPQAGAAGLGRAHLRPSNCSGMNTVVPSSLSAAQGSASPGGGSGSMGGMGGPPGSASPGSPGPTSSNASTRMVLVDVVMVRTEDSLTNRKGINLLSALSLQFGGTSGPAFSRLFTNTVSGSGATETSTGSTVITRAISVPALSYTLNIANANNNLNEVLARPTLAALECQKSEFFSGTALSAAVVGGSTSSGLGGGAVSVERRYGVKLTVVPEILGDGMVKLSIDASRTFLKPPSKDIDFTYRLEISEILANTNVVMRMGDTIILGGLSEKETTVSRDGVPLLQDIPLVQYLFASESKSDYQKSVLILITPRPAAYTWMSAESAEEFSKQSSPFTPSLDVLRARYSDWFRPYPNLASVFFRLNSADLYREFRTGDVTLESWERLDSVKQRLRQALKFLYF